MKEGYYAVYRGKEYRAARSPDLEDEDMIILISDDLEELNKGFSRGLYGITKKVKTYELDTAYNIRTYAIYEGYRVQISAMEEGKVLLYTRYGEIAQKLNMEQTDKFSFHKWVPKAKLEKEWEQRELLWGFE